MSGIPLPKSIHSFWMVVVSTGICILCFPALAGSGVQLAGWSVLAAVGLAGVTRTGLRGSSVGFIPGVFGLGLSAWWVTLALTSGVALSGIASWVVPLLVGLALGAADNRRLDRAIAMGFVVAAVLSALLGFLEVFVRGDLFIEAVYRSPVGGYPRAAAFTGSSFSLGYLIVLACALIFSGIVSPPRRVGLRLVLWVMLAAGLVATWSLGPWVSLAIGIIVLMVIDPSRLRNKMLVFSALLAIAVSLFLSLALSDQSTALFEEGPLQVAMQRTNRLNPGDAGNSERIRRWQSTVNQIADRPMIGNQFEWLTATQRESRESPESWYLFIARDSGLPALTLYLGLSYGLIRGRRRPIAQVGVVLAVPGLWIMPGAFPPLGLFLAYAATRGWLAPARPKAALVS